MDQKQLEKMAQLANQIKTGRVKLSKVRAIIDKEYAAISDYMRKNMKQLIVLMNDLSGGTIKLGKVCGINNIYCFDNFEVKWIIRGDGFVYRCFCITLWHMGR